MTRRRLSFVAAVACLVLCGAPPDAAAQTAPSLGTAQSFAVLGGSTVTNTGTSVITGDLGVSPGSAVTGFPPGLVSGGTIHAADAVALQAQSDVTTAYNALVSQTCTADLTGQDLGGMTLTPGVYCFSASAQLTGTLTLNALGNANAVFVFKIGSTLTTASNASVVVTNGGLNCNTYWQVGSSATVGTGTTFAGNILALTSITLTTGARVFGRTLARNGAVTLDTNTVDRSACVAPAPGGGGACPAVTVAPATLPAATVGVAFTQTFTASGGTAPYTFAVIAGAPPTGLTLSSAGLLAGTPTAAGTTSFTIRALDAAGCSQALPFTATVAAPAPAPVPTLSQWAMFGLALLIAASGVVALRARHVPGA